MPKSIPQWILYQAVALPLVITAGHMRYTGHCRSTGDAGGRTNGHFRLKTHQTSGRYPRHATGDGGRAVVRPRRRRDLLVPDAAALPARGRFRPSADAAPRPLAARVNAGGRSCEHGMPKTGGVAGIPQNPAPGQGSTY